MTRQHSQPASFFCSTISSNPNNQSLKNGEQTLAGLALIINKTDYSGAKVGSIDTFQFDRGNGICQKTAWLKQVRENLSKKDITQLTVVLKCSLE